MAARWRSQRPERHGERIQTWLRGTPPWAEREGGASVLSLKKVEQVARAPRLLYKEGEHADGTTEAPLELTADERTTLESLPPIADAAALGAASTVDLVVW
jgi:hypothetical protein